MLTDKELVKSACDGDAHSFALLYEKIYKKMYSFALYTLNNEADAKDVVSEAVLDAYTQIKKLKNVDAFNKWIFTILSNKCKNKIKDYYIRREESDIEECTDISDTIIDQGQLLDVRRAFKKLDEQEKTIVSMHHILGYKTKEVAKILGVNENTVRSKESRALKKMREWLT